MSKKWQLPDFLKHSLSQTFVWYPQPNGTASYVRFMGHYCGVLNSPFVFYKLEQELKVKQLEYPQYIVCLDISVDVNAKNIVGYEAKILAFPDELQKQIYFQQKQPLS